MYIPIPFNVSFFNPMDNDTPHSTPHIGAADILCLAFNTTHKDGIIILEASSERGVKNKVRSAIRHYTKQLAEAGFKNSDVGIVIKPITAKE